MAARLSYRFLDHARRHPRAPALLWRGRPVTYGELRELAAAAATRLQALGPAHERPAAVVAPKSPAAVALVLGCLMAGRPVLVPSADLPRDTLEQLLVGAGCSHVLTPHGDRPLEPAGAPPPPAATAVLLTTSGSTGLPKVVPLTHHCILAFGEWAAERFGIRARTTVLGYAPLNFDLCLLDVWTTLEHGGCVALVDPAEATRAGRLLSILRTHEVHVVQGVPMLYQLLLEAARGAAGLESVAHVIVTGDRLPGAAVAALPRLFPRARIANVYGCTETNDSFIHEVDPAAPVEPLPIGRPLPGVDALIAGPGGDVVEVDGSGELLVATPFQTPGYLPAELDDGRFLVHPRLPGRRLFRTGDVVRRDHAGVVTLLGRADAFVKVRGVRVSTAAVEEAIAGHPDVLEAAVCVIPDDLAGHRLHAIVRRHPDSDLNSLAVRRHCARSLDRAAVPSMVEVVSTALPRTATGKVDRRWAIPHPTQEQPQ
jgi:acyl-coenzyme A synthetase/AMP-(fatty) acid ligase